MLDFYASFESQHRLSSSPPGSLPVPIFLQTNFSNSVPTTLWFVSLSVLLGDFITMISLVHVLLRTQTVSDVYF